MKKLISIIFILNLLIFTTSCQKNKNKVDEVKKENSVPKELQFLIETTDNVEEKLLELKLKSEENTKVEIQKDKEKMMEHLEKEKKSEEEAPKPEEKLKTVKTYEEKLKNIWSALEKQVENEHMQLNNYRLKAIEDKADKKNIEKLDEDLNNVTISIREKDLLNSFINNNEIYNDTSYFLGLYKSYDSQIIKLKYNANNIYINGLKNEWDEALKGISEVDSQYSEVLKEFNKEMNEKEKLSTDNKKKEKDLEKLKLSIDSLKQSLGKKDIELLAIKRDIIMKNIEKIKE